MQVICIRNVSEISHFLTVMEFNKKIEEKHVGKSLQDFWVRLKRGSGYGTERMRNGTERIWRNGTERIWG